MKKVTKFIYNDIVLYAKGWYERSGNICEDLDYMFSKIYGWTSPRENEVAHRMLKVLDRLYKEAEIFSDKSQPISWLTTHSAFESEIRNRISICECSRDIGIIYVVLGVLQGLSKDEIELEPPYYGRKEHFRMGSLFGHNPISMTYTEMNRRAEKMFERSSKKKTEEIWRKVGMV